MARKKQPDEASVIVAILRELLSDKYEYPDPFKRPSFESAVDRVALQFSEKIPEHVWRRAMAKLDEQQCLDRARDGSNKVALISVNDHGVDVLRSYEEAIEQNKPKTNVPMLALLISLAGLAVTVAVFHLTRQP